MDLAIIETGNGGDLVLSRNDLALQGGWGNMPYLAMFGGNKEAVTQVRLPGEQGLDWWGNTLLMENNPGIQFNSVLERRLDEVPVNSAGRIQLEQAIKKDLAFMQDFARVSISVTIIADDRIRIDLSVRQPEEMLARVDDVYKEYIFIWDATKRVLGDFSEFDFDQNDFYI